MALPLDEEVLEVGTGLWCALEEGKYRLWHPLEEGEAKLKCPQLMLLLISIRCVCVCVCLSHLVRVRIQIQRPWRLIKNWHSKFLW